MDPDEGFDSLSGLAEADVLDTLGPTEFDDEVETGKVIEIAAGADSESAIAAVTPDEPKLGGVNEVLERLLPADAAAATGQPAPLRASKKRLGEILVDMQAVTAEQIDESLARQKETHKRLGEQLLDDKLVSGLTSPKRWPPSSASNTSTSPPCRSTCPPPACCRNGCAGATPPYQCAFSTTAPCRSP